MFTSHQAYSRGAIEDGNSQPYIRQVKFGREKGWEKEKELVHRNGTVGKQGELSVQHSGGETTHDRFGLNMEVTQHFIGAPTTDETNDVSVNLCAKEGHGAGRTKRAGTDIRMKETDLGRIASGNGGAKSISNVRRADTMPTAGEVVRGDGRCRRCGVVAKVANPTLKGLDWAEVIGGTAKADDLTTNAVLLGRELKRAKSGGSELGIGARQKRDATASNKELNITKGEGSGIGRGTGVFAGTEKEEKGEDDHVRHGQHHRIVQGASTVDELTENLDGNRLDPSRRGVNAFPRFPEAGEPKIDLTERV